MKNFKGTKGMLILIVLVFAIVGYYYYLANRTPKETEQENSQGTKVTAVQNVLLRNLERDYPPTPKEVVKYFAEITKCFYSEKYTEDEFNQLAEKIQQIYDDELVASKEQESYLQDLKDDIEKIKADKYVITTYKTSASTDVDLFEDDGYEWARLYCTFYMVQGTRKTNTQEKFLLRKDEAGHWKIYGWELAD